MNAYRTYWNQRQINDKRLYVGALAAINGVISSALSGKLPSESAVLNSFKTNLVPRMIQTFKNGAINALQSTEKIWGDTLPPLKQITKSTRSETITKGISVSDLTSLGIPNDKKIIQTQCMTQITTMSTTLHGELKKQFSESISLGESQSELITRIQGIQEQAKWKARRIAQTETTRLYNGGSMIGYRKSTIVTARQWIANIMGNVRPAHLEAHEQIAKMDKKFFVMDEYLDFPGDPIGSPGNTINCHCGIIPIIGKKPKTIPDMEKPGVTSSVSYKTYSIDNFKNSPQFKAGKELEVLSRGQAQGTRFSKLKEVFDIPEHYETKAEKMEFVRGLMRDKEFIEYKKVLLDNRLKLSKDSKFFFGMDNQGATNFIKKLEKGDTTLYGARYTSLTEDRALNYSVWSEGEKSYLFELQAKKGSKVVFGEAFDLPEAMFLPGSKYKLGTRIIKTITRNGITKEVEKVIVTLVDDGSDFLRKYYSIAGEPIVPVIPKKKKGV